MLARLFVAVAVLVQIFAPTEATFDLTFVVRIAWDFLLRLMGEVTFGNTEDIQGNVELLEASDKLPQHDQDSSESELSGLFKLMFKVKDE